jgi:hypothetical protein
MATVKLRLKPLKVPNFVIIDLKAGSEGADPSVPLSSIDHDALEDLAYGFLTELYKKAGKSCPFYRPARAETAA